MKLKYYLLLSAFALSACDKEIAKIDHPDFSVSTASSTYKVNEEIKFDISGKAEIISFYSGEELSNYDNRDSRIVDLKNASTMLEFTSSVQTGTQAGHLSVMVSTDFNGDYSSLAKVKEGNWTDITSRFALGTTATFLASGQKDITDFVRSGKPLYIAYRYVTKPQAVNGLARQWYIQSFFVKSSFTVNNVAVNIAEQLDAGFRIVDENATTAPARSSITQTRLTLYGNQYLTANLAIFDPLNPIYNPANPIYNPQSTAYVPTARVPVYVPFDPSSPYNDPLSEHWAVSKAFNVFQKDFGPDKSVPIKGLKNSMIKDYRYTFTKAGVYKVVFVASNNSIDSEQKVVKEITLNIVP